jgi:hypothetical protein
MSIYFRAVIALSLFSVLPSNYAHADIYCYGGPGGSGGEGRNNGTGGGGGPGAPCIIYNGTPPTNALPPAFPSGPATTTDSRSVEELYQIALGYAQGKGVRKDDGQAVEYYRLAANKGHLDAMHNLAVRLQLGLGTRQDPTEALRWYRKAAAGGYGNSMYVIATRYATGIGVEQDQTEAARWMIKAIGHGSAEARQEMYTKFENWNFEFRETFQQMLRNEGFYSGPTSGQNNNAMMTAVDGLFGSR